MLRVVTSLIAAVFLAAPAWAHRLDELLQACFVSVGGDAVEVEIRLLPGIDMAGVFLAEIDLDRDGILSSQEGQRLAEAVWNDVELWLDGRRLAVVLMDHDVSTIEELRAGLGFVRVRAQAALGRVAAGEHRIVYVNRHRAGMSVYLVNALAPVDPRVVLRSQARDELQTTFRLAYTLRPEALAPGALRGLVWRIEQSLGRVARRAAGPGGDGGGERATLRVGDGHDTWAP